LDISSKNFQFLSFDIYYCRMTFDATHVSLIAAGATDPGPLVAFAWIMVAALLAPTVSYATGKRIPAVVLLIAFGLIIGPNVLSLAEIGPGVSILKELGLGMLFLLAGYEIDPQLLRGKQARAGLSTWLICAVLSFAGAFLIIGSDAPAIVLAIAMTSTAIGTLLPILKQQGMLETKVGKSLMLHGAIGEISPILAMALLLSTRATWLTATVLFTFAAIAVVVAIVPRTLGAVAPWITKAMVDGASATNQTILRMVLTLLAILMAVAAVFELDVVLGAFAAGFILRTIVPERYSYALEQRLDVLGYGLLIPVFFVCSGMTLDPQAVAEEPWLLALLVPLFYITRGLPIFLREQFTNTGSGLVDWRERAQLSLYSATALPIIVAVTEVAVSSGILDSNHASILVAAGSATVLLFPLIASLIKPADKVSLPDDAGEDPSKETK
jgi:Kef-type K+ transport system membrane component KefB